MSEAVTTFDEEYSDPAATAAGWEEARQVLEEAELVWVSIVRADGRPHVTPVVAVWAEEALWFSTGASEQKFANTRANPHVAMVAGPNRWDGGLDVVVEGETVHVTDDAVLGRVAGAFAAKWDGRGASSRQRRSVRSDHAPVPARLAADSHRLRGSSCGWT